MMLSLLLLVLATLLGVDGAVYSDCGGSLSGPHGTIQSPNFPGSFPVPINCRWVIHAPASSKIVIYFTQYFLRHSFFITEYDYYVSASNYYNKNPLGQINAEDRFTSLVAYRSYVILDLIVTDPDNLHLRVEEFLTDVHGFNITYSVLPQDAPVIMDTCSALKCSYLGNCLASADYSSYSCECFKNFYGEECEKGPHCDPAKGKNMCLNGGNCRYFYGSLVNVCECPPGFNGPKCEQEVKDTFTEECAALKCAHHCEHSPETSQLQCTCNKGFKLKNDGTSCVEEEFYRISVHMPVGEQVHVIENLSELVDNLHRIISQSTTILQLSGLVSMRDFTFDYISEDSIELHFYVEKTSLASVNQSIANLIRKGKYFGVVVNASGLEVEKSPELKLLAVENSDGGPGLEGKLMTLICTARGSEKMNFTWYKDGEPFNMALTHRNAWEIRLPETIGEQRISVLNIDGVTTYDKGEFTCKVSDFGQSISGSVLLDVLPYPQVEVTPMTISAVKGTSHMFRCLSPDENQRTFNYAWAKNNRLLTDLDSEIVEDLLPSGSRLLIKNAQESANYTCHVTNRAGTSSLTVFVSVANANMSRVGCQSNRLKGVNWTWTQGGFFNLQKCPTDATGVILRSLGDGYTKRRCTCKMSVCEWGNPMYTQCQSVHLIEIYDMVMKIQLGYQDVALMDVFARLYNIAKQARGRMLSGDVDIVAKILHMIVTIARDFPPTVTRPFEIEELVDLLNILLEETISMLEEEKQEIQVGGHLIQVVEALVELSKTRLVTLSEVHAQSMDLRLTKIPQQLPMEKIKVKDDDQKSSQAEYAEGTKRVKRSVAHNDIELPSKDGSELSVLMMRYDQAILPLLDRGSRDSESEETFVSDVYSYIPMSKEATPKKSKTFVIDIPHRPLQMYAPHNKSYCLAWERTNGDSATGGWVSESCSVLEVKVNLTRCLCSMPGHFTAVLVPVNLTSPVNPPSGPSHLILLISCILSLCCLSLALMAYLVSWRCLGMEKHNIHFNFTLSVTGINLICMLCLIKDEELMCIVGKVFLQFFTVAAFTFLLLDAIQLFTDIHARTSPRFILGAVKFCIIGWAIPALCVVCVVLMMELVGYDKQCKTWCWWTPSHPHFYSVLIPLVILAVGHTIVLIFCLVMLTQWNDEWRFRDRWKSILEICRSELLLVLLAITVTVGILHDVQGQVANQALFVVFDIILAGSVLVLLVVLKQPLRLSVQGMLCPSRNAGRKTTFSEFRAFMSPGSQTAQVEAEVERIHEYCNRVDRERYTNEHKRQLRFLLNSSSSSGSSGVAVSPPPLEEPQQFGQRAVRSGQENPIDINLDSGISEGTESEKSSTTLPLVIGTESHDQAMEQQPKAQSSCSGDGKENNQSQKQLPILTTFHSSQSKARKTLPHPSSSSSLKGSARQSKNVKISSESGAVPKRRRVSQRDSRTSNEIQTLAPSPAENQDLEEQDSLLAPGKNDKNHV